MCEFQVICFYVLENITLFKDLLVSLAFVSISHKVPPPPPPPPPHNHNHNDLTPTPGGILL